MGVIRRAAWGTGAGIGLILSASALAGEMADLAAPEPTLVLAAHSSVVPLSQTEESLNGAPAVIPGPADPGSIKAPAITGAVAGNDVFIMVTGGQGDDLAVSETVLAALADAGALAGAALAAGPWTADNALAGADVSGAGAMPASIPGKDGHGRAASDSLARLAAALADAAGGEQTPGSVPENITGTAAPMALAAHGEAINASEIE